MTTTDSAGRAGPIQRMLSRLRSFDLQRKLAFWLEWLRYQIGFVAIVSTWRNAIAHITVRGPQTSDGEIGYLISSGTGFLVAKDLVLTARHVVDELQEGDEIILCFDFRDKIPRAPHESHAKLVESIIEGDWALLRCLDPPVGVQPLALVGQVEDGRPWRTFGYPDPDRTLRTDAIDLIGEITNGQAVLDKASTIQLFSTNAGLAPLIGISGSPIMMSRERRGAPDNVEWVAIGLTVEALTGNAQVGENNLYAYPMRRVLQLGGQLIDYDRPRLRTLRWLGRLPIRYARAIRGGVPFWALIPMIFVVLTLAVRNWPDEWVPWIRSEYPFQQVKETPFQEVAKIQGVESAKRPVIKKGIVVKEVYTQKDSGFALQDDPRLWTVQTGTDNGHYTQAAAGLKTRREWIRSLSSMMGPNQKLLRGRLAFSMWYNPFDAEIQVEYTPLSTPQLPPQRARVLGAVASLVRLRDLDASGTPIGLPYLRDQLVFVDFARAKFPVSKQDPPVLHLQPPNRGETLELLLHIEGVGTLPDSPNSYRIKLFKH